MTPLRILFVLPSMVVGGTERQVARLACELSARGHDVTILLLWGRGPVADEVEGRGPRLIQLDAERRISIRTVRKTLTLPFLLRRLRPDVLYPLLFWPAVAALLASVLTPIPLRVYGRRNIARRENRLEAFLDWLTVKVCDVTIANSAAVAQVARSISRHDVHVIRNGIDVPDWRADVRAEPPEGVVVANLLEYKGHLDLIEALAHCERPPRIHLVGEGPERGNIQAAIRAHGLGDRVLLHGHDLDPSRWYRRTQFAVLPSWEEGLPNAVLEAMAGGLPVIAANVGGVSEIVTHRRSGMIVPPREPERLAEAVTEVASDGALRASLGDSAREIIRTEFSWERCVREHEMVFSQAEARPGRPYRERDGRSATGIGPDTPR